MKKIVLACLLILTVITGCANQEKYSNEDVAAKVMGKEITVGDVRFLYDSDNHDIADLVEHYVKEEIMIQEVRKTGVDLSSQVKTDSTFHLVPPPEGKENPVYDYYQNKAELFGMDIEEFYKKHNEILSERDAYIAYYIKNQIGQPESASDEEHLAKLNKMYNNLIAEHKDEVEILIK